ncbi:AAA family ATPase [Lyngbya sp. CCY1209]|uniref:AAA family ATPase n=1 Tax=Lyngbya sp. CCY1209 TaxID=2886103 RepID=UPI002D205C48|nr:AAA family ATPase [Lyngbya sp. CCY1209]MEB3883241.1 AAA family ATPase [Lyngbya sp. CCY1209]
MAIVGASCLAGGAAAFFISPSKDAVSTIFGSTLGGLGGATVVIESIKKSSGVTLKTTQEIENLKQERQRLNSEVKQIQDRLKNLTENLSQIDSQLTNKQNDLKFTQERLDTLEEKRQDLQVRLERIKIQNPNLGQLEEIAAKIGELSQQKSGLEGQVIALSSQIKELENKRQSLATVEAQYHARTGQLQELAEQITGKTEELQTLQTRQAELEVIRASYDALSAEQQNLLTTIRQLRPEIERLEAEKQRILQAIQGHQQEYQEIEQLRMQIRNLNSEIRRKSLDFQDIENKINTENLTLNSLRVQTAHLQEEKQQRQEEIERLRGELENLSNNAEVAMKALTDKVWNNLPPTRWNIGISGEAERQFLQDFITYLNSQGLTFPRRVVNAFHTSLKVQDISALVVLAGISGTGKSELPQRYADFIGAQRLTLAVQPRWDSPQDLQGFYNYIEKKFKPTDLMRGLYQYNHDEQMRNRIVIVLLDEMNLARVEYYFSDFLSKLESRRSGDTYLEIDLGSLPLREEERRLKIPEQFLFVGTMNEDETTQTLSDKVLDRANVLTFGKPENLRLREENQNGSGGNRRPIYLDYRQFKTWTKNPQVDSPVVQKVKEYLDKANDVMEKIGHPFAHRVYQAITKYVVNYPGVTQVASPEFRHALADQFGQKLLPKLRGLMVDDYHEELEEMKQLIDELNDPPLNGAFEKARNSSTGQFEWKGLIYPEE